MRIDFELKALSVFDAVSDQPDTTRDQWLADLTLEDPDLAREVKRLLAADQRRAMLPTVPVITTPTAEPASPPKKLGNYRLIRELGRGGMGVVYFAERADGLFEQRVAIKLMRRHVTPRAAEAFDAERRFLARVEHAGVARLIDGGVAEDGRPWLATEYVAGKTIDAESVERSLASSVQLVLRAAQALQFVHGQLIAHGDVKPTNILVDDEQRVKILDFGVASLIGAAASMIGASYTPGFASPERVAGAAPSVADDVYALGSTLAAITGDADRELLAVISRATAPENERYRNAQEFITELENWLGRLPVAAMDGGVIYHSRKFVQRHLLGVLISIVALIGLLVSTCTAEYNYRRAEQARAAEALRFADAHRAAHYLMFTLLDQLERQPGTLRLRSQVGDVAQAYLDQLASSPEAPRDVRLDVAKGYLRAASMAGMGNAPNLADVDRAKRDLLLAASTLEALRREQPNWPALVEPVARTASLACQTQIYANHDAGKAVRAAHAGEVEIAAITSDRRVRAAAGWQLRICAGDALVWLDHADEAVSLLEKDVRAARPITTIDNTMFERNLRILGEAYFYAKRYLDAERVLKAAQGYQEAAHAREPFYGPAVIEAANVADDLASTYDAERRFRDQLRVAQSAVALVKAQAALDPDDLQSARRALSLSRLVAGAQAKLGDAGKGVVLMERADEGWQKLMRRFPDDATTARLRLLALQVTGDLQRQASQQARACTTYAETAQGWDAFGRRWRLSPSDAKENVASVRQDIAACSGRAKFVDS